MCPAKPQQSLVNATSEYNVPSPIICPSDCLCFNISSTFVHFTKRRNIIVSNSATSTSQNYAPLVDFIRARYVCKTFERGTFQKKFSPHGAHFYEVYNTCYRPLDFAGFQSSKGRLKANNNPHSYNFLRGKN